MIDSENEVTGTLDPSNLFEASQAIMLLFSML